MKYSPLTRAFALKTLFLILSAFLLCNVLLFAQKVSSEINSEQPQKMGVWSDPHGALGLVIPSSQKPVTEAVPVVAPGTTYIFNEASGGDTKDGASGLWWWTIRNFQYNLTAGDVWVKAESVCSAEIECGCYAESFVWNTFQVGGAPGSVVNAKASIKTNVVGNLNKASAPPGSPIVVVYFLLYDMTDGTNIYKILHENDLTGPFSVNDPGTFIEGKVDFKTVGGQISANLVGGHTYRLYLVLYTRAEQTPVAGVTNITEADYFNDNPIRPNTTGGIFRDTLSITLQPDLVPKLQELSAKSDSIEAKSDRLETAVGAIEVKADSLEAKADALEGKADAIEAKIDQWQRDAEDLLELHIEEYLYYDTGLASLFLPASLGGRLELVRDIVEKWILNCEASGIDVTQARKFYDDAVAYFNANNYKCAFKYFSKAYRMLTYPQGGCGNEPSAE